MDMPLSEFSSSTLAFFSPVSMHVSAPQSEGASTQEALSEAEARIWQTVDLCEKDSLHLPVSARKAYRLHVRKAAEGLIAQLYDLSRTDSSGKQLLEIADKVLQNLPDALSFAEDKQKFIREREITRQKLRELDAQVEDLSLPFPQEAFKRTEELQQMQQKINKVFLKQARVKESGLLGVIKSVAKDPLSETEQNPVRQKVVSGAAYAVMGKYMGVPLAAQVIAGPAAEAEHRVQRFLDTASPQDHAYQDGRLSAECLDLYQAAQVSKVFLKATQMPERAFHVVHDHVTDAVCAACDAIRLTDQSFADFAQRLDDL